MTEREFLFATLYGEKVSISDQQKAAFRFTVSLTPNCRFCGNVVSKTDFDVVRGYYQPHPFYVCHKSCKKDGIKREAFDCQCLDADCNDCRHFKRGKSEGKGIWRGNCEKFDTPTMAYAICCTGHECFEHRLKDDDCRTV